MIYTFSRTFYSILTGKFKKNGFKNLHTGTSKDISKSISDNEDFSSPVWRKSVFLGFCVFIVYKMDQWYASLHEEKGFFTRFFEHFMINEEEYTRLHINKLKESSEAIKKYMHHRDIKRESIYKLKYPELLDPENTYVESKLKTDVS
ncbi:uncharacterized protein T551_03288 [Pneumocystis jirovecii RU7]|uniref:Uncharacterized protein n=1 Tax=Pneumocystis jirovecii (strain RU7) TaxID=1408657 RepID=A0A0W4ZET3_PNEJ7|nr:uncharacterized protein T551_03288 [Pneumocystis jirovecii RU7]KTW26826.1 hypothetical protein T551_03288 [Pneumocystis jirovecii RU7]